MPSWTSHYRTFNALLFRRHLLVLEEDAFHAWSYACKDLIRNRTTTGSEFCWREFVAKDSSEVAFFARYISNIYHADIHTDVAHIISLLPVNKAIAFPVAKQSVQSVSITYWQTCNTTISFEYGLSTITNAFACFHIVNLQDCCAKGADVVNGFVVATVDAIKPKPKSHHLEVTVWEMFNASTIADVPQNGMWESILQLLAALQEQLILLCREVVEVIRVAANKVREY